MINYDISWNPVRLEQRMGRIHHYGQEKDCLILNCVATNTREGRVPRGLLRHGEQLEPRFGKLGKEYKLIAIESTNLTWQDLSEQWKRGACRQRRDSLARLPKPC